MLGTCWFVAGKLRFQTGPNLLLLFLLLYISLECWVKYRDSWTKVSRQFWERREVMISLPVPTPTMVTSTGVKRPLA